MSEVRSAVSSALNENSDRLFLMLDDVVTLSSFEDVLTGIGMATIPGRRGASALIAQEPEVRLSMQGRNETEYHTDGVYIDPVPDYIMLFCERAGESASPTLVCDSLAALQQLDEQIRTTLRGIALEYVTPTGGVVRHPVVCTHPRSGAMVARLSTAAAPVPLVAGKRPLSLRSVTRALSLLYEALDAAKVEEVEWIPGRALLFDNHRFVHGRTLRGDDRTRRLHRLWLSHPGPNSGNAGGRTFVSQG